MFKNSSIPHTQEVNQYLAKQQHKDGVIILLDVNVSFVCLFWW